MPDFISKIVNWEFMDEELYRWFLFFGALILISIAWRGVLGFMRDAV